MSELKETISTPTVPQGTHTTLHNRNSVESCRKCGNTFKDTDELKKHLRIHTKYIPCRKFSSNSSDNKCSWGEKCGYSHQVLESGTLVCWDCGNIFKGKNDLMIHRKNFHDVPICIKFKTNVGCDKPDEDCWYPHKSTKHPNKPSGDSQTNEAGHSSNEEHVTYANMVSQLNGQHVTQRNPYENEPKQDFPKVPQNKSIPTTTEMILMEIMKQNKLMMETMMSIMKQNQMQPLQS